MPGLLNWGLLGIFLNRGPAGSQVRIDRCPMKRLALVSPCLLAGALIAQAAHAESLIDGVYR